ncbi:MAG: tRNA adenosine(34) deaminase TadA [Pseudomonadales bacterium]|nr:tRNA adenosine(34) deaminase TadA [Pseudomonadales bacterium]
MTTTEPSHEYWMQQAFVLARQAGETGEVPVGAILVAGGKVLGRGANRPIAAHDPTAHAEILALREAALLRQNYRLPGSILYVTLEPCTMCLGAMIHARVQTLVFAAREPRFGAVVSQRQLLDQTAFNHQLQWQEGPLAAESAALLKEFFRQRRG